MKAPPPLTAIKKAVIDAGYEVGENKSAKPEPEAQKNAGICPVVIEDDKESTGKPITGQNPELLLKSHLRYQA